MTLYCIALPDEMTAANLTLIGGAGRDAAFEFRPLAEGSAPVAVWPGTSSPAFFTVRPTMQIASKVPSDAEMTSSLASSPDISQVNELRG
jgi:hypothetical protein